MKTQKETRTVTRTAGANLLDEVAVATAAAGISIYDRIDDPMKAAEQMGHWLAKSGMVGVRSPEQGMVVALTCMHEGIHPIEFARRYHIIDGRPSMRADYMLADFLARGWEVDWRRSDRDVCQLAVRHPARRKGWYEMPALELAEFRRLGITGGRDGEKDNWARWPRQMLRARAISEVVRMWEPGIVAGIYTPEEVSDMSDRDPARPSHAQSASRPEPEPAGEEHQPAQDEPGEPPPHELLDEKRKANILAWFGKHGVGTDDLEAFLGAGQDAWDDGHAVTLAAVRDQAMRVSPALRDDELAKMVGIAGREPGEEG